MPVPATVTVGLVVLSPLVGARMTGGGTIHEMMTGALGALVTPNSDCMAVRLCTPGVSRTVLVKFPS